MTKTTKTKTAAIKNVRDLFQQVGGFSYPAEIDFSIKSAGDDVHYTWRLFCELVSSDGTSDGALSYLVRRSPRKSHWDALADFLADFLARIPKTLREFERSDLPDLGPIQITSIGEENMYFTTTDGAKGFVKIA